MDLAGQRVVVTRARAQASDLSARLTGLGAIPVEVATIETVDPRDGGDALRAAAARIDTFDWIVLTSVNGVDRLADALRDGRVDGVRIAAVGTATAARLAERDLRPTIVPDRHVGEALVEAMGALPDRGRVLIAQAEVARSVVVDGLGALGFDVSAVAAYRTIDAEVTDAQRDAVRLADVITFTASSTVERFCRLVGADLMPPLIASIGPITSATIRELGFTVDVEAEPHTIDGLVAALMAH